VVGDVTVLVEVVDVEETDDVDVDVVVVVGNDGTVLRGLVFGW
jgi:NAD kinase